MTAYPTNGISSHDSDNRIQNAPPYGTTENPSTTLPPPILAPQPTRTEQVSWRSLPRKSQLAVIFVARLSEPLVQTSLTSYMFYQLKSFSPHLPDSAIAGQMGIMQGSFKAGQLMTAMIWGRVADSDWAGRKTVLMVGLSGTLISCLGFGFSSTFYEALAFRTFGGALNGNIGVMRTMISETVREKKYQSRAFLLMPMCVNIGSIFGPLLGGILADLPNTYPEKFGDVEWMKRYPYALPNIVNAGFMLWSVCLIFLGLEETLDTIRHREDFGSKCNRKIREVYRAALRYFGWNARTNEFPRLADNSEETQRLLGSQVASVRESANTKRKRMAARYKQKLPFRRIFTTNVINTLTAFAIISLFMGSFGSLWPIFLSTSVSEKPRHLPFIFGGGLGMPAREVGFAIAILGTFGIFMQIFVYPTVTQRLGTIRCWRIFLWAFPIAAICAPFLALIPSITPPPAVKDGPLVWLGVCGVLIIQVVGRVFVGPGTAILVNNCAPHPSVLATTHGISQTVSSAVRTVAPVLAGYLYGASLNHNIVGAVWWGLAAVGVYACAASQWVVESDGHEIQLPGDDEIDDD